MQIHVVKFDDWEKLYVNGKLAHEGHRLDSRDFIDALKKHGKTAELLYVSEVHGKIFPYKDYYKYYVAGEETSFVDVDADYAEEAMDRALEHFLNVTKQQ